MLKGFLLGGACSVISISIFYFIYAAPEIARSKRMFTKKATGNERIRIISGGIDVWIEDYFLDEDGCISLIDGGGEIMGSITKDYVDEFCKLMGIIRADL